MQSKLKVELITPIAVVALSVIGCLFIYSSSMTLTGNLRSSEYLRQIIWAAIGIILMAGCSLFDYRRLNRLAPYIYGGAIVLLVITLFVGKEVNGARSWIYLRFLGFQPSEFSKLATILMLSNYLSMSKATTSSIMRIMISLAIASLPMLLTTLQPDLGTATVFFPMLIVVLFMAGIPIRYIMFLILIGVVSVFAVLVPVIASFTRKLNWLIHPLVDSRLSLYIALSLTVILIVSITAFHLTKKTYYYWLSYATSTLVGGGGLGYLARSLLKEYQVKRMMVFLKPEIDPKGAGWNVLQSITAVGSGGVTGKGFLDGTQSNYQFLPQQSTDFIFSIIAEEWGFVGGALIFLFYSIIFFRAIAILGKTVDTFGLLVGSGIIGVLFFHFLVNIGMAMGIMPVTGIPLLFVSYGGSALWMAMLGVGIIMSLFSYRY